jgi:hypothetical protein
VWLCCDLVDKQFVALKVVRSASSYTRSALQEIECLKTVHDTDVNKSTEKQDRTNVGLLQDYRCQRHSRVHDV